MRGTLTSGFLAETARARGYVVHEGPPREISGGAFDSRHVAPGDLFAAFRGERHDGNAFVAQAVAAGAAAVVCERADPGTAGEATIVVVPDTREAMKALARAWRDTCPATVIGITGTVGKTTAKEVVASTLATRFRVHRSPGNMNSREGLPLAVLSLRRDHEISVLELAMDSPGEILELCEVARPDVGVVLNIGLTHISKLGSVEAIAAEKLSLVRSLPPAGTAILNAADPRVAAVAPELSCRVVRFGPRGTGAEITWEATEDLGLEGVRFDVSFDGAPPIPATSPLGGAHTLPAALAALAVAVVVGLTPSEAVAALANADVTGRVRVVPGLAGSTILDDRYNSSPASLAGALRALDAAVRRRGTGRRLALVGTMAELGSHEDAEHRAIGRLAAETCDGLYAVGDPCRALVEEAVAAGLAGARWFVDKDEAALALRKILRPGDVVLVKASRGQEFETVIPRLTGED